MPSTIQYWIPIELINGFLILNASAPVKNGNAVLVVSRNLFIVSTTFWDILKELPNSELVTWVNIISPGNLPMYWGNESVWSAIVCWAKLFELITWSLSIEEFKSAPKDVPGYTRYFLVNSSDETASVALISDASAFVVGLSWASWLELFSVDSPVVFDPATIGDVILNTLGSPIRLLILLASSRLCATLGAPMCKTCPLLLEFIINSGLWESLLELW